MTPTSRMVRKLNRYLDARVVLELRDDTATVATLDALLDLVKEMIEQGDPRPGENR